MLKIGFECYVDFFGDGVFWDFWINSNAKIPFFMGSISLLTNIPTSVKNTYLNREVEMAYSVKCKSSVQAVLEFMECTYSVRENMEVVGYDGDDNEIKKWLNNTRLKPGTELGIWCKLCKWCKNRLVNLLMYLK